MNFSCIQTKTFPIGKQVGDFFVIRVVCLPLLCDCKTCQKIDLTDYVCRCKCGKTKILSTQKILDIAFNSCVTCQAKMAKERAKKYVVRDLSMFSEALIKLRSEKMSYPRMAEKLNEIWPEYEWNDQKVGAAMRRLGQRKITKRGHWLISDDEILQLHRNKKSYRAIAAAAGVSRTSAHKKVKALLGKQK